MYECPNCAANLKFDIARQQMYCEYCGTQADPYIISIEKEHSMEEGNEKAAKETMATSGEYEVMVFTCSQCGGEIISEDTTAATFCSFCGSSAILDSRIGKERRPTYILCKAHHVEEGGLKRVFRNALRPSDRTSELAMLPVWFLSYRNGDRVSYAVVNGQTGKAAADLPVDGKRYLAGSFLLAVPLFFVLNLFLTMTPGRLLLAAVLLAIFCLFISNGQLSRILARESGEDDKGLASVKPAPREENSGWQKRRRIRMPWDSGTGAMGKIILIVILFYVTALLPGFLLNMADRMAGSRSSGSRSAMQIIVGVQLFIGISFVFSFLNRHGGRKSSAKKSFLGGNLKKKLPVLAKPLCGIVAAIFILIVNPVSDWFYYIGAFVCMGSVLWAILDIIRQHNKLTTRKLPQLNRRGGDEVG